MMTTFILYVWIVSATSGKYGGYEQKEPAYMGEFATEERCEDAARRLWKEKHYLCLSTGIRRGK